jgi:signal transduction histidine kinase
VIQRLFGTGLSLQGIAATLTPGPSRDRLMTSIGDIDETISQIRTTIYQLGQSSQPQTGLRARLLAVVIELTPSLGLEPAVRFAGVLEGTVPDGVADDLVAVLREGLTNVARHAAARSVTVTVTAESGWVTLAVTDDGRGLDPGISRRSGLANLRRRAEQHGGELVIQAVEPTGTHLRWSARIG